MADKLQIIAFYLPQFHPTPKNDEWWGKGFTEWTNVGKAKKLFPGHYQPKVPSELGYYDLRLPQVRMQQAEMAKDAGVTGFCYYHYWFSEGNEMLEGPFNDVVDSGEPDFPFCLCWANQSWYSKFWNKDGSADKKLLAEQLYPGTKDNEAHFYSLLKAFKDERYIKIEGKLLFVIYDPYDFKDFESFKKQWNELANANGLSGFYFVAQTLFANKVDDILQMGYDGVNHCHRLDNIFQYNKTMSFGMKVFNVIKRIIKIPFIVPYSKAIKHAIHPVDYKENVFPTMMPNWDHTPRSNDGGTVLHGSTPELFKHHAKDIISTTKDKIAEHKVVFLKSWNEWGEGNYMEPDIKFGRGYIKALREVVRDNS